MADTIDYKAVLEDLKGRKTALEQAIIAVEAIISTLGETGSFAGPSLKAGAVEVDSFIGLNILQAAEKYLQMIGKPAKTTEQIAAALNKGGMSVSQASVSTILRRSDKGDSPVTRVGRALWGLASWYPNKSRKAQPE